MLLRALARHESSPVGDQALVRDIEEYETNDELIESRATVADYTEVLEGLYLIANQEAYRMHLTAFVSSIRMLKGSQYICALSLGTWTLL